MISQKGASTIETIIEAGIVISGLGSIYKYQWFDWIHVDYTVAVLFIILFLLFIWAVFSDRKESNDDRD